MLLHDLKALTADPCVITMVGVSGSGKSTLANEISEDPYEVLSADHWRGVLTGNPSEQCLNAVVFQYIYEIVKKRSSFRQRSILDATNLRHRDRKAYYGPVTKGLPKFAVIVHASLETCLARQELRDRQVPIDVIETQYERYERALRQITDAREKWDGVFKVNTENQNTVDILR